ncbi:MAG: phosphoribosylamine--glycine ligase [Firmicutes bacterium HGW-Firmicutes-11]|jgi:phosphoribosylamine--glycine ligase|nr:MAG: phosphoribosylamine--glycine ligase [Firmicutes bacterium HGW-Firmicutes-11]
MNILVIGGGGREHAIIRKLKENPTVDLIYAIPGNGGISYDAECIDMKATDLERILAFTEDHDIGFAVVGPDDPLALGAVDLLLSRGIPTFGPSKDAAVIESSKVFAKDLMQRYDIPTATYDVFYTAESALDHVERTKTYPIVLKADGLALGKGVIIAETKEQAAQAVVNMMIQRVFGNSGDRIVIEEYLSGPEVSVLAFTDSKTLVPMVSSMDHKRAFDHDRGPNTGGMGTIAPNPYYTEEMADRCMKEIFLPTMAAMNQEGRPFKGCLYFGLMLTEQGPKVIEYNCRFGDPETQVVLPLLATDLLTILQAVVSEDLASVPVAFREGAACCVVAASGGYPGAYSTGYPIRGLSDGQPRDPHSHGVSVYHAGTRREEDRLLTAGGRVLGVTGVGPDLESAIERAYKGIAEIDFEDIHYRRDIGRRALLWQPSDESKE